MSKKKKRRSSPSPSAKSFTPVTSLADETTRSSSKRFDPLARNLLFGDLIVLALSQFLTTKGIMSEFLSNSITLIGFIVLLIAIWIQFGKKDSNHYL